MEEDIKFIIFQTILFLLVIISLITINSINEKPLTIIDKQLFNDELVEKDVSINHLIGTCPRDRTCTRPTCSLWSDLNDNGICDRGEK
jgi:hypothetical protein